MFSVVALFCILLYCNPLLLLILVPLLDPACCRRATWDFPGEKRPGREVAHTTSFSAEVNAWSFTFTASYVLIDWCLIIKINLYIIIIIIIIFFFTPSSLSFRLTLIIIIVVFLLLLLVVVVVVVVVVAVVVGSSSCCCCEIYTDNFLVSLHNEDLSSLSS